MTLGNSRRPQQAHIVWIELGEHDAMRQETNRFGRKSLLDQTKQEAISHDSTSQNQPFWVESPNEIIDKSCQRFRCILHQALTQWVLLSITSKDIPHIYPTMGWQSQDCI